MKKNFLIAGLLVFAITSYSQKTTQPKPFTQEYYLEKSKQQRNSGNILLGLGTAAIIIPSFFISDSPKDDFTMAFVSIGMGTAMIIGSAAVFNTSEKNRKNGMMNSNSMVTGDYFLQKSTDQRITGYLLLGLGVAAFIIPPASALNVDELYDEEFAIIALPMLVGASMFVAGFPVLIASGANKSKGMKLSFNNETAPFIQNGNLVNKSFPSLSLKIGL